MSNHAEFNYAGRPFGSPVPVNPLKRVMRKAVSLFKAAISTTLRGQDSVAVTAMSSGLDVYCGYEAHTIGYANGGYTTMPQVYSHFPGKKYVSVGRDCIDIEPGLASAGQAPAFFRAWKKVNTNKPVFYADASDMPSVIAALTNAGIARSSYYVWVAEWNNSSAIPSGYDGKQYASNNSFDSDVFYSYIFGPATPPPPPPPEFPMSQGSTYTADVKALQTNLNRWASVIKLSTPLTVDGNFGPATAAAVKLAQAYFKDTAASGTCSQLLFGELAVGPGSPPPPPPPPGSWVFGPLRSVTVSGVTASTANVSVESPGTFIGTPPSPAPGVDHYEVAVAAGSKLTGPNIATYPRSVSKDTAAAQSFQLNALAPNTQYTVGVRAALAGPVTSPGTNPNGHAGPWVTATFTTASVSSPPPVNANFPLTQGSTDTADVKTLQTRLNAWGFGSLTVDGNFGPLTAAAVSAAQTGLKHHEPADGQCDQTLFDALLKTPTTPVTPPAGKYPGPDQAVAAAFAQINGEIIYGYLRQHGYNEIQAAGATASMWGEGEWSPEVAGSGGWGLMGWTGNYPDSRTGNPAADMATQLALILKFVSQFGDQGVVNQMASATTVLQSANLWGVGVERFGINDVHSQGISTVQAIALKLDGVHLP